MRPLIPLGLPPFSTCSEMAVIVLPLVDLLLC